MLPDFQLIEKQDHKRPADKRRAIDWARDLLGRKDWIILDTETTGLDDKAQVIQIAVLSPDNEILLDTYVRPLHDTTIPAEATAVHGITIDQLRAAPSMPELMPRLKDLLADRLVITYNAKYDARLLRQSIAKDGDGGCPFAISFDCAMLWYARYAGEWQAEKEDYRWQKLPGGDHSAIGDCRATLALIRKLANAQELNERRTDNSTIKRKADDISANAAPKIGQGQTIYIARRAATAMAMLISFIAIVAIFNAISGSLNKSLNGSPLNGSTFENNRSENSHSEPGLTPGTSSRWLPIILTNQLTAELTTTVHDAGSIDYQFQLGGPQTLLRTIFAQQQGKIIVSLLADETVPMATVAIHDLSRDRHGNLLAHGLFACPSVDYARCDTWKIRLSGFSDNSITNSSGANARKAAN